MKVIIPWLIALAEFGIIIYLLVNVVAKMPDPEEVNLEPVQTTSPQESSRVVSPPPPTGSAEASKTTEPKYKEGDQLSISQNAKLREKPGGEELKVLTTEETLTVKEGPIAENGETWWKVEVTGTPESRSDKYLGLTGYIADGDWLQKKN